MQGAGIFRGTEAVGEGDICFPFLVSMEDSCPTHDLFINTALEASNPAYYRERGVPGRYQKLDSLIPFCTAMIGSSHAMIVSRANMIRKNLATATTFTVEWGSLA